MARTTATAAATKAAALRIAAEKGAAEASRQTGVPAGSIRAWRSRAGASGPPASLRGKKLELGEWIEARQAAAVDAWEAAQGALAEVRRLQRAGKAHQAQQASLSYGVLLDKHAALLGSVTDLETLMNHWASKAGGQIVRILRGVLDDFGFEHERTLQAVVSHHLRQLAVDIQTSPPAPEEVRRAAHETLVDWACSLPEVRERLGAEIRAQIMAEVQATPPPRQLPAPSGEVVEVEPMAGLRRVVRVVAGPVDGEVVEATSVEPPVRRRRPAGRSPERAAARQVVEKLLSDVPRGFGGARVRPWHEIG